MTRAPAGFIVVLAGLAAVSFAAGRMTSRPPAAPPPPEPALVAAKPAERPAIIPPATVPDLLALPFVEAYRMLRGAPPATAASYFQQLRQLPPGPTRDASLQAFFRTLIQANPTLARDLILQLPVVERELPARAMLSVAPPRALGAVAEFLASDTTILSDRRGDMLRDCLEEWAHSDPAAVQRFFDAHQGAKLDYYFDTLAKAWAAEDPEAAQRWMDAEIAKRGAADAGGWGSALERMQEAWLKGFVTHDPDAAVAYILEHLDNPIVAGSFYAIAGDLYEQSPERARDFVRRLPPAQQSGGLQGIGTRVLSVVPDDGADNSISPRAVAEWMLQFPPAVWAEGDAMRRPLMEWLRSDRAPELYTWIAALPEEKRAAVLSRFPGFDTDAAPEQLETLMQVSDTALRDGIVAEVMDLAKDNRDGMLDAIAHAHLTPEQQARLAALVNEPARTP